MGGHQQVKRETVLRSDMKNSVDELIELLKRGDSLARRNEAKDLGEIGPRAEDAIPLLIEVLNDENFNARSYAELALGKGFTNNCLLEVQCGVGGITMIR